MVSASEPEIDVAVRRSVYDYTLRHGTPPQAAAVAGALGLRLETVGAAFARLAAARVLVLQPGTGEILMAMPFSAVPTPFLVDVGTYTAFANCMWDALGIPAMLHRDALIRSACGCCGLGLEVRVTRGALERAEGVVHFVIPARRWWDDVIFT